MILRRIIEHVRKQEWTAIGIDFLIVVFGVLLAFQITDWNTRRAEAKRADAALVALVGESREAIADLEEQVATTDLSISQQRASIEAILAGALPAGMSQAEFVSGVTLTRRFIRPAPPRSVYDGLLANGDISLIRDEAVIRQIARFYANVDSVQDYTSRMAASSAAEYHPAIRSHYDPSAPDLRRQDADFAELAADPQFAEDFVDNLRSVVAVQNARRGLLRSAVETYALLCTASGDPCADLPELQAGIGAE